MKKKILLLGGSHGQIPAIQEACARDLYTVLCDYLPDNPGSELVDEFHLISTTDKEAVLELAQARQVDFVLAYASDPATPTAAYVSEKMDLPGNSIESVRILSEKHLFRDFQKKHGFKTPAFRVYNRKDSKLADPAFQSYPLVVKPVDSSDTKGVTRVNNPEDFKRAMQNAFKHTRSGQVIVEEYISPDQANLHGDAFFFNGKMVFCMLGDYLFASESHPLKPSSTIYPTRVTKEVIERVKKDIENIVKLSGFTSGAVNLEIRIDQKGDVFLMEIGPRSGGSLTPQTIWHCSGFDMLKATYEGFLEGRVSLSSKKLAPAICFTLHTNKKGKIKTFDFDAVLNQYIAEKHLYVKPGDEVLPYSYPGSTIGVLILQFKNFDEVDALLGTLYERIQAGIVLE